MISNEIREFIGQMKTLGSVGCILVADASLKKLVAALGEAVDIVSRTPVKGRVVWRVADRKTNIAKISLPSILVVSEKEYAADKNFAERVRGKAAYFINVA